MSPKRRFSALVLTGFAALFVAACGGAEPLAVESASSAVTESPVAAPAAPSAPVVPPALPLVPTTVPAPSPADTPQGASAEPAKFPTPEPWQPSPVQPIEPASSEPASSEPASSEPADPVPDSGGEPVAPDTSAVINLTYDLGACLFDLSTDEPAVVPCAQPHLVEVYHVGEFPDSPGSPHPGEAMLSRALEQCAPSFEALPGVAQSGESYDVQVHGPSQGQWDNGERFLACLLVFPEPVDQPLTEIDRSAKPAALGACFAGTDVNSLVPTDCQEPHRFQVYATTGVLELAAAEDFCRRALGDEALFVDFNRIWQADVIVGDDQVDCYLSSAEPTIGSVFDEPTS